LARRATAIAQLRQEHAQVLLLDSGDSLFQGWYVPGAENPDRGAWVIEAMNAMGYDAMAMGDRELQAALPTVRARFAEAQFPILSANVEVDGELPNVQPYLLRKVKGHTIAIVGATAEQIERRTAELGVEWRVDDPVVAVAQAVDEARKSAEVVIVLSDLERSAAEALALAVPGIDAIIGIQGGNQREPVAIPGVDGEVVLHASGMMGEYLGVLTLHLNEQGEVTGFEGQSLALTDRYADDPEMVEIFRRHAARSAP
jgi:5'-nucleotidase / UDP-sugar diphosphatase